MGSLRGIILLRPDGSSAREQAGGFPPEGALRREMRGCMRYILHGEPRVAEERSSR